MSFKPAAALVLHGAAASIFSWGYTSITRMPGTEWIHAQKGGFFQHLTIQGLIVAWLTVIVSLVCDLIPSITFFKNVKRLLLMTAMPLAIVISTIYWPLYVFMPELLTVDASMVLAPLSFDLALHAAPAVMLVADFFFFEKRYSKKHASFGAPVATLSFSMWYIACSEYFASFNGNFPYPFLDTTVGGRAAIYAGAMMIALVSFWALNSAHS